uniref:DUF6598 domain-containing protein n=1 Tax=Oryza glumipatula TaxID=40148 RepID=A0A0E0B0F7_9ORYZ
MRFCGVSDNCPTVDVHPATILEGSSHRDGSIYKFCPGFIQVFQIADRHEIVFGEACLEPLMLSQPMDCQPNRDTCTVHFSTRMMQIFSIKLAKIHMYSGPVQIYGYIAVRDHLDSMLNYVVNRSRDGIIVKQGSCIEMVGPKRGISMSCSVVLEFDMRIKKGDREEDDLELIDGALEYSQITTPAMRPMNSRVSGNCGAVDITLAYLYQAVEATIEVSISKVRQEIQLFDGMVGEPCGLRRYVVAVASDTWMHLKFKVCEKGSKNDVGRYCSFKANRHGFASQQIVVEPGAITVKTVGDIL